MIIGAKILKYQIYFVYLHANVFGMFEKCFRKELL